jgi:5,10-methylene-tetrahydrofolate dehydrogenase/methenyl tetrahydrofolate cyclohydrolase
MNSLNLSANLRDKIYKINVNSKNDFSTIISYFPLSEDEKQLIVTLNNLKSFDGFHSIFSDSISEQEWNKSKSQIIKHFQDELFDID